MRGSISSKPNINPVSNKLIDILDDKKKMNSMNENFQYKQLIHPRLEKLKAVIFLEEIPGITNDQQDEDLQFIIKLKDDLKNNPHYRLTKFDLLLCNKLWSRYKT